MKFKLEYDPRTVEDLIVEEKTHEVQIVGARLSENPGKSGYHYLQLDMQITSDGASKGLRVTDRLTLSPEAGPSKIRMRNLWEATRVPIEEKKGGWWMEEKDFIGKRLLAETRNEDFEGRKIPRVRDYFPLEARTSRETRVEETKGAEETERGTETEEKMETAEEQEEMVFGES